MEKKFGYKLDPVKYRNHVSGWPEQVGANLTSFITLQLYPYNLLWTFLFAVQTSLPHSKYIHPTIFLVLVLLCQLLGVARVYLSLRCYF